jgi:8-oxo-dGTP pyrophosphatase MutT (NUDIX family)
MDSDNYSFFYDGKWFDVELPMSGGEGLIIPNVSALVFRDETKRELLLQRRDKPGEAIRGKLEIPSGRWRAGETPQEALQREVEEETGLQLTRTDVPPTEYGPAPALYVASHPLFVVSGFDGGYPALLVVYECIAGAGEPRPRLDETRDPGWFTIEEVKREISANPDGFTPPAYAILSHYLTVREVETTD